MLPKCRDCGAPLDPCALACPGCHALTHAEEIEALVSQAQRAQMRRDFVAAKALWAQAAALLPSETVQYTSIRARITEIDGILADPAHTSHSKAWGRGAAGAGATLLAFLGKAKFLLLGLTKLTTLFSMLAFAGVYWGLYGWKLAVGFVLTIYIHEMGHVIELNKYGIPASAPIFIPGFGAMIMSRGHAFSRIENARVGLAGPIYGFGAALLCFVLGNVLGSKYWMALAHLTAVINLFNLIPVWQLDGSRGFASLTRAQRGVVLAAALALWWFSGEMFLVLIAIAAVFRLFTKDAAPEPDQTGLVQFLGLLGALTLVMALAQNAAR